MSICQEQTNIYNIDTVKYNENKIKTKTYSKSNVAYTILNYDKEVLCDDDINNGYYRSIIASSPENKLLAFSPQKSLKNEMFIEKYPNITETIFMNEIIEGTMVNLFFDERIEQWEISTRGAVGGSYFYYRNQYELDSDRKSQTSFYQMFLEALSMDNDQPLNQNALLGELPKNYSYSFVLQHPDNHIVLPISKCSIYMVAVYELLDGNNVKYISPLEYQNWDLFKNVIHPILFPKQYNYNTYDEAKTENCSIQTEFTNLGVMVTNVETGERTSLKNPRYEEVKLLRGNNPNLQYQYLCLRKTGKIQDFLFYFPQYKSIFYRFYQEYENFVTNVHYSYLTYYVQKQNVKISKKFAPHIYKIHHELYLSSLNTEVPIIIKRRIVKEYFDNLEPREMIYHLNYDRRQYAKGKQEVNNVNDDLVLNVVNNE
jgi:hypothetical protein